MTKPSYKLPVSKVPLTLTAHELAKQFSSHHADYRKSRQVYLNTLAVCAVSRYLNSLGWGTSLETSDSANPVMQALMDVADLDIPNYGKLECRTVLAQAERVYLPSEVRSERLGYVIVRLSDSLREAILLGFIPQTKQTEIPLTQLQSLMELPAYLAQSQYTQTSKQPVHLSKWLEGVFESGWQRLEELFPSPTTPCFYSSQQTKVDPSEAVITSPARTQSNNETDMSCDRVESPTTRISRVKLLEIKSESDYDQIALVLNLLNQTETEIDIWLKICPTEDHPYLPDGLQVIILDDNESLVTQTQAKNTETVEFHFSGKLEESFSVKVCLNSSRLVETFTI